MPYSLGRLLVMYLSCLGGWAHAAHAPKQHLSPYQQQVQQQYEQEMQQKIEALGFRAGCLYLGAAVCQCFSVAPLTYVVQHIKHEPSDESLTQLELATRNFAMCSGTFCLGASLLLGKCASHYEKHKTMLEDRLPQAKKRQ